MKCTLLFVAIGLSMIGCRDLYESCYRSEDCGGGDYICVPGPGEDSFCTTSCETAHGAGMALGDCIDAAECDAIGLGGDEGGCCKISRLTEDDEDGVWVEGVGLCLPYDFSN